ncbi:MAG TPA: hypothetical protein VK742_20375 [Candidatus Sulfotelmatobacter sp.]|jgi:hypothetical protein|nr:hypothetical protein [Candidatus Sulfotelmatobacter sp.]
MNPTREQINNFPELLPGDILLYGGNDLVSRLIQFRTWSDVSHIEIYVGGGRSVASRNGIGVNEYPLRIAGLRRAYRPKTDFWLDANFDKAMAWFQTVKGTPYGWADLARFYLIDIPTRGLICSEFGDLFFRNGGLPLFNTNYPEGAVCPGDNEKVSSLLLAQIWSWK